ncbi:MAG: chorismate-binding protein [Thermaerobacterales bacterium]
MFRPTEEEFLAAAQSTGDEGSGVVIPVLCRLALDEETPISLFRKLVGDGPGYLLESLTGGEQVARYSFVGAEPVRRLVRQEDRTVVERWEPESAAWQKTADSLPDPFAALRDFVGRHRFESLPELPRFSGGAVGFLGYDAVRHLEHLPDAPPADFDIPEACFLDCGLIAAVDHSRHALTLLAPVCLPAGAAPAAAVRAYRAAVAALGRAVSRLKQPVATAPLGLDAGESLAAVRGQMESTLGQQEFESIVSRAREYILAGDVFQVVLSRRLSAPVPVEPLELYRSLRVVSPAPYMFFFRPGFDFSLVGASPEMLVRVEDRQAITRPLAGTRPRGKTEQEDRRLADELSADVKEQAEHTMLVDLGRNDLGRVCRYGSVVVKELMAVERHSHVMHLVSQVAGYLDRDRDPIDALAACFPAGTLSGAPKVRAMEIIDELEVCRRGPYGGAFGYLSFAGNLDTCIIIRTLVTAGERVFLQTGAGIVADSDPAAEWQETENKARAGLTALGLAIGSARAAASGGQFKQVDAL